MARDFVASLPGKEKRPEGNSLQGVFEDEQKKLSLLQRLSVSVPLSFGAKFRALPVFSINEPFRKKTQRDGGDDVHDGVLLNKRHGYADYSGQDHNNPPPPF
jgi:hypothetical protein